MKAIVAKVLFGGIFGCLYTPAIALAAPKVANPQLAAVNSTIISANPLSFYKFPSMPQIVDFVDSILTVGKLDSLDLATEQHLKIEPQHDFDYQGDWHNLPKLAQKQLTYSNKSDTANMVLGFQNTFWAGNRQQKYWGLTTVEHWGKEEKQKKSAKHSSNISKLNYLNAAPSLVSGTSTLTVSGGGNANLAKKADVSREFQEFRGGVTYHHGVGQQVTMGLGFVYEDLLIGFTQLTYRSSLLPLKTTVSLMAKDSGIDLHSHVRFNPVKNLAFNYYGTPEERRFDANWVIIPGLTLMTKSDSRNNSFSTGLKIAIRNDFLSLSANAALDHRNNLNWNLNSQIGRFKFAYSSNQRKNTAELNFRLLDSETHGFQCATFFKYQTLTIKQDEEQFSTLGGRIGSIATVGNNKHRWTIDLGYGAGVHGQGLIASSSVALKENMFLKLNYQEVSATSDDTRVNLLLSSQ